MHNYGLSKGHTASHQDCMLSNAPSILYNNRQLYSKRMPTGSAASMLGMLSKSDTEPHAKQSLVSSTLACTEVNFSARYNSLSSCSCALMWCIRCLLLGFGTRDGIQRRFVDEHAAAVSGVCCKAHTSSRLTERQQLLQQLSRTAGFCPTSPPPQPCMAKGPACCKHSWRG